MTLLIATILADSVADMKSRASAALAAGADGVELRLDALKSTLGDITGLADDLPTGRWIATCRPTAEGGRFTGPVEERIRRLLAAGRWGEGFIDFEFNAWKPNGGSALARNDLLRPPAGGPAAAAPSLILSHHDFDGRPPQIAQLLQEMSADPNASVIKIAWPAESILSNFEAFDIMQSAGSNAIAICLGDAGLLSRLLAKKFGAFATYCALDKSQIAAPGQLTLGEMRDTYRWDAVNAGTDVFGVIGHPVGHSISPMLFNQMFAISGLQAVYLPMLVEPSYEAFAAFMDKCLSYDGLDARGFSVTLPHKEHAYRYLGDRFEPPADSIGAINTIRFEDGELWGCNSDCDAALEALTRGMECNLDDLDGLTVDVLGAGGVARAVSTGLADCGCRVTLFNRDGSRASALADAIGGQFKPWDERQNADGKVLVNCTSVGMWPNHAESPMPPDSLQHTPVVFDTVYRPLQTRLLKDAQALGCRTISGADMFVAQAAMQFEFWIQQEADRQCMSQIVHDLLSQDETG